MSVIKKKLDSYIVDLEKKKTVKVSQIFGLLLDYIFVVNFLQDHKYPYLVINMRLYF